MKKIFMMAIAAMCLTVISCGGGAKENAAPAEKAAASIDDQVGELKKQLSDAKNAGDQKKVEEILKTISEKAEDPELSWEDQEAYRLILENDIDQKLDGAGE